METTEKSITQTVAETYGKAAKTYHKKANIQKKVAEGLMSSLMPWKEILPRAPILEVGCGTGFLSELLIENFPRKEIIITDASEEMLAFCKKRLAEKELLSDRIKFELLDANSHKAEEQKYGMVISNFTPHWFKDTALVLEKLSESIVGGGLLLCSFPGNHSFEQWYEKCLELGLPYTANTLPDVEEVVVKLSMGPLQIDYYENDLTENFEHSIDFFRNLKAIGANTSIQAKSLTPKQFRLLTNHWDQQTKNNVNVRWHMVYIAAKKDM